MIKILLSTTISLPLIFGQFLFTNTADAPPYSTTAVVTLVGAKIAAQKDVVKKHKRKESNKFYLVYSIICKNYSKTRTSQVLNYSF